MDVLLLVVAGVIGAVIGGAIVQARAPEPSSGRAEPARADLEDRLRTSRDEAQRMTRVLTSMADGVMLFGPDGRAEYRNPALERHLGPAPASIDQLLPLAFRRIAGDELEPTGLAATDAEVGSPTRWLRGTAVRTGDGGVLLTVRDVTERRRLDLIRRDFVANASHELKTPAATIQAAAETIKTAAVDDPAVIPRFAAQLEREAVRLSRIVGDLLDLSRLESGSEIDDLVALDAVIRDEAERFVERAAEGGVRLRFETPGIARVRGSARDLALMIRNLVDNAIRYTPPGGEVRVSLTQDGRDVVLSVADTGMGIPKRDLPRIFERFYRIDRARSRETGGTGLGLAIVRHVVENHAGTIDVDTELGAGTRFDVRLPLEPPARDA